MKKTVIAVLAVLCLGLTACGDTTESTTSETTPTEVTNTTAATTTETTITTTEPVTTTTVETTTTQMTTEITTTTEETETSLVTMEDNPEGMYPMRECCRRIVEIKLGSKVVSIGNDEEYNFPVAILEDGRKCLLSTPVGSLESDELFYLYTIGIKLDEIDDKTLLMYFLYNPPEMLTGDTNMERGW